MEGDVVTTTTHPANIMDVLANYIGGRGYKKVLSKEEVLQFIHAMEPDAAMQLNQPYQIHHTRSGKRDENNITQIKENLAEVNGKILPGNYYVCAQVVKSHAASGGEEHYSGEVTFPLIFSARHCDVDIFKALMEKGADRNQTFTYLYRQNGYFNGPHTISVDFALRENEHYAKGIYDYLQQETAKLPRHGIRSVDTPRPGRGGRTL